MKRIVTPSVAGHSQVLLGAALALGLCCSCHATAPAVIAPGPVATQPAAQVLTPLDLRTAVLAHVRIEHPRQALARVAAYVRPLQRLPQVAPLVSAAGLARRLFGGLEAVADLQRPLAVAVVDEGRRRFRLNEQLIVAVAITDTARLQKLLQRRFGAPRRLADGSSRYAVEAAAGRGLYVRVAAGYAYLSPSLRLHRGAASVLGPLLGVAPAAKERLSLRLELLRIAKAFPRAWVYGLALLRHRLGAGRGGGLFARLLRSRELVDLLANSKVLAFEARLASAKLVLEGHLEGGSRFARFASSAPPGALIPAAAFAPELPVVVIERQRGAAAPPALSSLLEGLPRDAKAAFGRLLTQVTAHLGPGRGMAFGAPKAAGSARLVAALEVANEERALQQRLTQAFKELAGQLRRGGVKRTRLSRFGGGRFLRLQWQQGRTAPAQREATKGKGRLRRRLLPLALGTKRCFAAGVTSAKPPRLLVAVGATCRAPLLDLQRRLGKGGAPNQEGTRAPLGSRHIALDLSAGLWQLVPLAAAGGWLSTQTAAMARMVLPPPSSRRPLTVALTLKASPKTPRKLRGRLEVSAAVLELGAQVAALMFRIGSYGGASGRRARP